jgi:PAS domain S-box-containing protein
MVEQGLYAELEYLRKRVEFLDEVNRFALDAIEMAATLGDFQQNINNLEDPAVILDETRARIDRLVRFKATVFYLIEDESNEFYPASVQPERYSDAFQDEFSRLVDEGTFAWALRNKKPVTVPLKIEDGYIVLHVMSTSSRIRGMFMGLAGKSGVDTPDLALSLLSIILLNSSNALESHEMYKMIREISRSLESRENYKILFEAAPDGVEVLDSSGRIVDCNRAYEILSEYGREQIIGRHTSDFLSARSRETYENMCAGLKSDGYLEGEFELERGSGTIIPVWRKEKAIYGEQGNFVGSVIYNRDISALRQAERDKKELEARLQRSGRLEAIGTLAGGIAHDFNNILMPILSYAELMLHFPDDFRTGSTLLQIIKGAERAADLIKQILLFSRQVPQEPKPLEIAQIVTESLALLRAALPSTIEIQRSIQSKRLVLADPTQIHQIMLNLCTNAAHAMREKGGRLSVSLDDACLDSEMVNQFPDLTPGVYLELTVSDTGHGMDESTLEHIFDPFFTTKEVDEGTGMGLAVVHGIVKSHKGAIDVRSVPGEGTTFRIYFPAMQAAISSRCEMQTEIMRGEERILFVDDEETATHVVKDMLEHLGYTVVVETSSARALQTFRRKPENFDLVITDYTMPHMTGDELALRLRRIRPGMPVIVYTGSNNKAKEEHAGEMGVSAFVLKPMGIHEFSRIIRKVLDGQSERNIRSVGVGSGKRGAGSKIDQLGN